MVIWTNKEYKNIAQLVIQIMACQNICNTRSTSIQIFRKHCFISWEILNNFLIGHRIICYAIFPHNSLGTLALALVLSAREHTNFSCKFGSIVRLCISVNVGAVQWCSSYTKRIFTMYILILVCMSSIYIQDHTVVQICIMFWLSEKVIMNYMREILARNLVEEHLQVT